MDVIVTGAQVPFVRGGAELHQDNLVTAIRAAGHRCELVTLPTAWEAGRLLDAPLAWRLLNLDCDLVVTTNFPSYFVRHPRKVGWLLHQHRGAYDAADAAWSDFTLADGTLEVQRQLSEWDCRALSECERLYSTSAVVADRLARFSGLKATPLHHPPPLHDRLHPGSFGDYVFCPTRLEGNKRPGKVLDAVAAAKSDVRAVIAGRGSLGHSLEGRIKSESLRVTMPGFVSDEELIELYADCLAVVYAPEDEDYGYVTLQAFLSGKPVITSADAGGVLEWVEDGVNGFVTDGSPAELGAAVDALASDPDRAAEMGAAGRARVADLDWVPVVTTLLGL